MKIKRWIVTVVDFDADGQCDGKARVLAVCKSEDEARNFITEDMREYVDERADEGMVMDEDSMQVFTEDCMNGCEWNVEEVDIEIDETDVSDFCNEAYTKGYADGSTEAEAVCEELR